MYPHSQTPIRIIARRFARLSPFSDTQTRKTRIPAHNQWVSVSSISDINMTLDGSVAHIVPIG
jgi:hypothetical protein